jgi:hypothetical protein
MKIFLRWLGRSVYTPFVPVTSSACQGTERYLEDLWDHAPWRVALLHTFLALIVQCLPVLVLGRPVLFSMLSKPNQEKFQQRLFRSRWYALRLIGYGIKGHALVATLRDPKAREELLQPSSLFEARHHVQA